MEGKRVPRLKYVRLQVDRLAERTLSETAEFQVGMAHHFPAETTRCVGTISYDKRLDCCRVVHRESLPENTALHLDDRVVYTALHDQVERRIRATRPWFNGGARYGICSQ